MGTDRVCVETAGSERGDDLCVGGGERSEHSNTAWLVLSEQ